MEKFDQIRYDIGQRLKVERERLGLTQTELADALGVGRFAVLKYENGSSSPLADHLHRLDEIGGDIVFITTGKRQRISQQQKHQFNEIYLALEKLAATSRLKVYPQELLNAAWMLFDVLAPDRMIEDMFSEHEEAIVAYLSAQ